MILTADIYIMSWSLLLFGMGVGFLVCQMVQPMSRWFGLIMFIVLFGMAIWLRNYGADVLLSKP